MNRRSIRVAFLEISASLAIERVYECGALFIAVSGNSFSVLRLFPFSFAHIEFPTETMFLSGINRHTEMEIVEREE